MPQQRGVLILSGSGLPDVERDTLTCIHCQKIDVLAPKQDPTDLGGFCLRCMKHICSKCADANTCAPWEAQMEKMEKDITARVERDRALDRVLAGRKNGGF